MSSNNTRSIPSVDLKNSVSSTSTIRTPAKNIFKSTTNKPVRFALLGPHKSSKSSITSIISNQISLENYYPTIQNSPVLLQFQPKNLISRAFLDINITIKDLKKINLIDNDKIQLNTEFLKKIDQNSINQLKNNNSNVALNNENEIFNKTLGYYDLDYSIPNFFENKILSPINSYNSPLASYHLSVPYKFGSLSNESENDYYAGNDDDEGENDYNNNSNYKPPVSTPILVELIDTPGVERDDLIPFLERSLDCKLSKDVLSNLANEYNTNYRSRVKPVITGSGMSDLNADVDGYMLCYSCIPEITESDVLPPSYSNDHLDENNDTGNSVHNSINNGFEALEILKSLYTAVCEAWEEYSTYHLNWENGKEYDMMSLSSNFKNLWKRKDLPNNELKDINKIKNPKDRKKLLDFLAKNKLNKRPPIIIVATHIDSELTSPLLIKKGKQLALDWGCSFVQVSCAYENWKNVEEALALLIRESIMDKIEKGDKNVATK